MVETTRFLEMGGHCCGPSRHRWTSNEPQRPAALRAEGRGRWSALENMRWPPGDMQQPRRGAGAEGLACVVSLGWRSRSDTCVAKERDGGTRKSVDHAQVRHQEWR